MPDICASADFDFVCLSSPEALPVRAGDIIFAGLGESRHLAGSTNLASAELVLFNIGVAMDFSVDEAADLRII